MVRANTSVSSIVNNRLMAFSSFKQFFSLSIHLVGTFSISQIALHSFISNGYCYGWISMMMRPDTWCYTNSGKFFTKDSTLKKKVEKQQMKEIMVK